MQIGSCIVLLLAMLSAACGATGSSQELLPPSDDRRDGGDTDDGVEAGVDTALLDSGPDSGPDAGPDAWVDPCEPHRETMHEFLGANRDCEVDSDCVIVGDCSGGFGFYAVNVAAQAEGEALSQST